MHSNSIHSPYLIILKKHYQIGIVFIVGLCLRIYMAHLDPFLHDWDERYHALVAKNMMSHPFKPMLYTHQYFSTELFNWTFNHIWLHKQPLFLWQMALSMKIFGVSEFAMRLPSVLMGSLMILLVYRLCLIATNNKLSALLSGVLLCCSNYYLNLISGREGMDHNDIAFGFYVLASLWAYVEYLHKGSWKWVILVGVFAGCAILNKWLTGFIVFAPWGVQSIIDWFKTRKLKSFLPFVVGLLICVLVFAPWQLYILYQFPVIAAHEYAYNAKHVWEVVEGHGGDIWTYLNFFPFYFGWQVNYFVPAGLVILFFKKEIRSKYLLLLILPALLVFCFFSFLVQTKMQGYFFMIAPLCIIYAGVALQSIIDLFGRLSLYAGLLLVTLSIYLTLNWAQIDAYTHEVSYRQAKMYNVKIYKRIDSLIPQNIEVVLNANNFEHVDVMFYSKRNLEVYHDPVSEKEFEAITKTGMPIAAFESSERYPLPSYISQYKNLYIIKAKLK